MTESLVSKVSHTVFGTAVAGFGFSFGRDIYRKSKQGAIYLILLSLLLSTIILPFMSASQTFRWHPITFVRWFFSKFILWLLVTAIAIWITYIVIIILKEFAPPIDGPTFYGYAYNKIEFATAYGGFFYLFGSLDGLRRRKKRKHIHSTEIENAIFMNDIGIVEVDGSDSFTHMDSDGNKFRLVGVGRDLVEFFVVGRRGKRAFIYLDEHGHFKEYSGIVRV